MHPPVTAVMPDYIFDSTGYMIKCSIDDLFTNLLTMLILLLYV